MNRMLRRASALLLLLLPAACDRPTSSAEPGKQVVAATSAPTPASAGDKSIMRPAIQAEAAPAPDLPAMPKMVTIPFAYNGAALDDAARATLDRLVHDPATSSAQAIVLRGHADAWGSDQANLHVSLERASAVRDYLVAAKVVAPITLIAIGERRPVRPSATLDGADDPAGRTANRRVEITLTPR